ncbi:two-component system, chemotaxis family, sensor kinase CheA [Oceanobacillus limi]|uniref:Chemotaxis protein CheA n=1 Tax=Oceanobacillus limi TaxID=930131 RepID=A0A1I0BNT8_9BACI|nr:chemotaxis protein CheA [Oceanobacillus limi]SET07930.1 two-component system, chemotaxis family, sensor kinase CheA [Oceanobacillus limi]
MDTNQYIEVFLDESREHLQAVNDNLLKLEKQPEDLSIVSEIFRSAHTLKGMAATMGFEDVASLTHQMENVLDKIRNEELHVSTDVVDITFAAVEALEEMVASISEGNDGKKDVSDLVSKLEQLENGGSAPVSQESSSTSESQSSIEFELDEYQATVIAQAKEQGFEALHINVRLNDDCILKAARAYMVFEKLEDKGDLIQTVPVVEDIEDGNFEQEFSLLMLTKESKEDLEKLIHSVSEINRVDVSDLKVKDKEQEQPKAQEDEDPNKAKSEVAATKEAPANNQSAPKQSKTIRVNLERIDNLMNLFEEVVIDRSRLEDLGQKLKDQELIETIENMTRVTEDMQGLMLSMRMVPVEQVFNRFPRMVRGITKELGKEIDLEITGADTELDRTVIDEIGDPLVHLIRNSLDHGIESPQKRKEVGKSETGKVSLRAFHSGNHVFIEIEDDGGGINREKVEAKAIENGLLSAEHSEVLSDEEIYQMIFSSGFSTADQISDISGRGVGLDVVRSKIESLGGNIIVESEPGKGSKFSIQLPLTLSILTTLLVNVQQETYAIPLSAIVETMLLEEKQVMFVQGQKVIDFRGKVIPLVSLRDIFNVPTAEDSKEENSIVIVHKGDKMAGLLVDSFIGQKEVVLKSLGNYLRDIFAISGATILGDGEVSLIIDPNALVK